MRVKYDNTWLTGGFFQEEAAEMPLSGSQIAAAVPLIDRLTPAIESYGNRIVEIPIAVSLIQSDELAAASYCHRITWELPASGQLLLREDRGIQTQLIVYPSAAFRSVQPTRLGTAVTITYSFLAAGPPAITLSENANLITTLDDEQVLGLDGQALSTL